MNRRPQLRAPLRLVAAIAATASLTACMNMSGLSGSSSYACKAPDGVTCDSVSGTYANALQNNLPSQRARTPGAATPMSGDAASAAGIPPRQAAPATSSPGDVTAAPLRSSARILRLWFKPWEDADRDLYDQGYVYVQIDNGQWLIEHAQRQIRDAYTPLRPPPKSTAAAGTNTSGAALPANLQNSPRPAPLESLERALVPLSAGTNTGTND